MGVREKLNENPALVTGACIVAVLAAIGFVIYQVKPGKTPGLTGQLWYTTDDGATWFADDAMNVPPFKKGGKDAVQAYVYRCPGSKPFVAYMQRYTPEGVKMFGQAPNGGLLRRTGVAVPQEYQEVKRPGASAWTKLSGPPEELLKATDLVCPDGSTKGIEFVYP